MTARLVETPNRSAVGRAERVGRPVTPQDNPIIQPRQQDVAFAALRAHPLFHPVAALEIWTEWFGGHPVEANDEPHLVEAIEWIMRAQNATGSGGIARGYSVVWNRDHKVLGWEPEYPETTGYIIPTLYTAAAMLGLPELADRATRAALREIRIQLPSGAARGGTMKSVPVPVVFNTGQVLLGWLAALEQTGRLEFATSAVAAGRWLVSTLDPDGIWRRGRSPFADRHATLYNARTAWALAEAGRRLNEPSFVDAAARALRAVYFRQHLNGWIPACCLNDARRPLLHTLAYAIRGLMEGGRVLGDEGMIRSAATAASHLAEAVPPNGRLAGRFDCNWKPVADWSCLTGNAQVANIWLRLENITGDTKWRLPAYRVLHFLKSTQNRATRDPGLRGGIKGSHPFTGSYGRLETLSWATKFFADALMRRAPRPAGVALHGSSILS